MDHRDMYGLTEADVNNLVVVRDYAMPGTGVHPVTLGLTYDFDLYFYAADCTKLGGKASAAADESGIVAGGTCYVVADLWLGANLPLTLTVAPVE